MILVTGATGLVGSEVVKLLLEQGVKVTAVTRDPYHAYLSLPEGVRVFAGDPSLPATIGPRLRGVTGLFVHPRAVGEAAGALLALARERGVGRVVVLSATNVDDDPALQPSRYNGDRNKEVEDAVVASGLAWTSLRTSAFAANALGVWGDQIRAGDRVRGPSANFAEAPIHERDLAEVAARALHPTDRGPDGLSADALVGQRLALTGPQSLTHAQMVAAQNP